MRWTRAFSFFFFDVRWYAQDFNPLFVKIYASKGGANQSWTQNVVILSSCTIKVQVVGLVSKT